MMTTSTQPQELLPPVFRHPGEQLDEIVRTDQLITERISGLLQTERKTIELLLKGKYNIVPAFAHRLEQCTGIRAELWMDMQIEYDHHLLRIKYADKFSQLWRKNAKGCRMRNLYF